MTINSAILIGGVRAVVSVYLAGDRALARHLRDRAIAIPEPLAPPIAGQMESIEEAQELDSTFAALVAPGADTAVSRAFAARRRADGTLDPENQAILWDALRQIRLQEAHDDFDEDVLAALRINEVMAQWTEGEGPQLAPWHEFAIAFGGIAFDFVGTNPGVLQFGGDAERLIGSFAKTADLILEDTAFTDRGFGLQLLSAIMRAGLQTLADERGLIFDEENVQELVEKTAVPILKGLENDDFDPADRRAWRRIALDLAGPVSQAAFGVLARHQQAFLGKDFDTETRLGSFTLALFSEVHSKGLDELLTRDGNPTALTLRMFGAVIASAAEHPGDLTGGRRTDEFLRDLLNGIAGAVRDADALDRNLGLEIAAAGFDALAANMPGLIRFGLDNQPWESVAERAAQQVLGSLSAAAAGERSLDEIVSRRQLVELGRIFFAQAAATPEMVAGDGRELGAVVRAVAEAMVADENLLLNGDDWMKIAAFAAREAGRNPGRLFGFDDTTAAGSLGARALGELLDAAGDALTLGRAGGNVLFGETLLIAIETGLAAISDDTAAGRRLLAQDGRLRDLANQISVIVAEQDDNMFRYGAREWLALWRRRLPELLAAPEDLLRLAEVTAPTTHGERLNGTVSDIGHATVDAVLRN